MANPVPVRTHSAYPQRLCNSAPTPIPGRVYPLANESSFEFTVMKAARGALLPANAFNFTLVATDPVDLNLGTALNDANGIVRFDYTNLINLNLLAVGPNRCIIAESVNVPTAQVEDWTLDTNVTRTMWIVKTEVEPGVYNYSATFSDPSNPEAPPAGAPTFVNTSTNGCANIVLSEMVFTEPQPRTIYTISEDGSILPPGWTIDSSTFDVAITVTDDGQGNLVAEVEYLNGYPTFVNVKTPNPVSVFLTACKIALGGNIDANALRYVVRDGANNEVASGTNVSDVISSGPAPSPNSVQRQRSNVKIVRR